MNPRKELLWSLWIVSAFLKVKDMFFSVVLMLRTAAINAATLMAPNVESINKLCGILQTRTRFCLETRYAHVILGAQARLGIFGFFRAHPGRRDYLATWHEGIIM